MESLVKEQKARTNTRKSEGKGMKKEVHRGIPVRKTADSGILKLRVACALCQCVLRPRAKTLDSRSSGIPVRNA